MATIENIGSDMEEEDEQLFRRRESEGLIKIRPPKGKSSSRYNIPSFNNTNYV